MEPTPPPRLPIILDPQDSSDAPLAPFYAMAVERILRQMVPPELMEKPEGLAQMAEQLPLVCWTPLIKAPTDVSFFVWCRFRFNAYRFFYEMVSRWSIPGKRLNAQVQFAIDFCLPHSSSQKYIVGEVRISIATEQDMLRLKKNLTSLEQEIKLGVESHFMAQRILGAKEIAVEEKNGLIQEHLLELKEKRSQEFDEDLFKEMQQFLVLANETFKHERSWKHLCRAIAMHYLVRRKINNSEKNLEKRILAVKALRVLVGQRKVLGLVIGVSFLRRGEKLDAEDILRCVNAIVPDTKMIEGSFVSNPAAASSTSFTFYLEVQKKTGRPFTFREEASLKNQLAADLKIRIETPPNPLFMPQNEEMILRHIVTLRGELKYVHDLPQLIIEFSQHMDHELEFLIVAVHVGNGTPPTIGEKFAASGSFLHYLPDRMTSLGAIGKKHKKLVTVFRIRLETLPFIRKDNSVDIMQARQQIVQELKRIIGNFRDYNGGTLAKEREVLKALRRSLGKVTRDQAFLLENFFYSIEPALMRSLLPIPLLKIFFKFCMETQRKQAYIRDPYELHSSEGNGYFCILIMALDRRFEKLLQTFLKPYADRLVTCPILHLEQPTFGILLHHFTVPAAHQLFCLIEEMLHELYTDPKESRTDYTIQEPSHYYTSYPYPSSPESSQEDSTWFQTNALHSSFRSLSLRKPWSYDSTSEL